MSDLTPEGRQARERVLERHSEAVVGVAFQPTLYVVFVQREGKAIDVGPDESSAWIAADESTRGE